MSIAAYRRTIRDTEAPRQMERRILANVTGRLEALQHSYDGTEDKMRRFDLLAGDLRGALWENQLVWMALKADLALPGNALSVELRAALLSLALWVERQTQTVMGGGGQVAPLVDVNRRIINGLSGSAEPEAGAA